MVFLFLFRDQVCSTDEEIARVLAELDREEREDGGVGPSLYDLNDFFQCNDDSDDPDYDLEVIEEDIHNSESEIDMDIEQDDRRENDETADLKFYIGKDNETIWASNNIALPSKTKSKNIIKTLPGPKGQARHCKTRLECFSQIFTPELVENIVKYTNIFIEKKNEREKLAYEVGNCTVRVRDYKSTTKAEIYAVFGALFLIGVKRGNRADLSEYFTKNGTGLIILRANFSENRFRFLLRSIRFDDINTRAERNAFDKLAPIREILLSFSTNSQSSFNLGEYVTIDEILVAFRGRCSFIQYMAQKPAKYGLKIYALCDARMFYTYDLDVYCGKQNSGPNIISNKPYDVVVRLVKSIQGTNRNVTTDNYFTSYLLAEYLLSVRLTFLGTMKKNKK